jgi:hypothetical protein
MDTKLMIIVAASMFGLFCLYLITSYFYNKGHRDSQRISIEEYDKILLSKDPMYWKKEYNHLAEKYSSIKYDLTTLRNSSKSIIQHLSHKCGQCGAPAISKDWSNTYYCESHFEHTDSLEPYAVPMLRIHSILERMP